MLTTTWLGRIDTVIHLESVHGHVSDGALWVILAGHLRDCFMDSWDQRARLRPESPARHAWPGRHPVVWRPSGRPPLAPRLHRRRRQPRSREPSCHGPPAGRVTRRHRRVLQLVFEVAAHSLAKVFQLPPELAGRLFSASWTSLPPCWRTASSADSSGTSNCSASKAASVAVGCGVLKVVFRSVFFGLVFFSHRFAFRISRIKCGQGIKIL